MSCVPCRPFFGQSHQVIRVLWLPARGQFLWAGRGSAVDLCKIGAVSSSLTRSTKRPSFNGRIRVCQSRNEGSIPSGRSSFRRL